jgi:5-methylcytosine-specific restriction endonuclease McrA
MPIRPENKDRYPKDWKAISLEVREAAGWKCEGSPAWPDCRAENGEPHPATGSKVVLTVAHLNHQPEDNGEPGNRPNLKAWCQRCHNTYDMPMRRAGIAERSRLKAATADMFACDPLDPSSRSFRGGER